MIPVVLAVAIALAPGAAATGAESPIETYHILQPKFATSPLGSSLYLESREREGQVSGDVFAIVQHPFSQVRTGLDTPAEWCEVLILHLNVKKCSAGPRIVQLFLGRKGAGAEEGNYSVDFRFAVRESSAERFAVALEAEKGPMGTRDYRLVLETIPIATGTSFLRISYAYVYGTAARLATGTYLRTLGKDKVGFTVTGVTPEGSPQYVGGLRGALERNTMRYYLAINTYLDSASQPLAARREWRFTAWYSATEQYPRQLHELIRSEYLALKR